MHMIRPRRFRLTATLFLVAALVASFGCAPRVRVAPPEPMDVTFLPDPGDFVSGSGEPMTLEQVADAARRADYILVGEGHRNPLDHAVQQRLAAALAAQENPLAVGLEMIAVDKQPVLDDFAQGIVPVDDLEQELEWKDRWGYSFSLFRGLFELAQKHSLPVGALNVPPSVARAIGRNGLESLDEDQQDTLPGRIVRPCDAQLDFLREVMGMHEGRDMDNATQWERFVTVQSVWDSKMAEETVALRTRFNWPVLVIAGDGHVENGWGIERRILLLDPDATVFSIGPWRGGHFDPHRADVFFYSPDQYRSRMGAVFMVLERGIVVKSVERDSRADKAGLRPGDVLEEANGVALESLRDIHKAGFRAHEDREPFVFVVRRHGQRLAVDMGLLLTKRTKPQDASAKDGQTPESKPESQPGEDTGVDGHVR